MTVALALPSVANAKLPLAYEAAKTALAQCSRIDECAEWANKAEALASYAKQADDDSLRKTADRIQARAIRRCGELLNEIKAAHGANQNIKGGAPPKVVTRTQAARAAGLSDDQRKQALRVARVPELEFERAVESDEPPTVTKLAEAGTQKQARPLIDMAGRDPKDFAACTEALGRIRDLESLIKSMKPAAVIRGASPRERSKLTDQLPPIIEWLTELLNAAKDAT